MSDGGRYSTEGQSVGRYSLPVQGNEPATLDDYRAQNERKNDLLNRLQHKFDGQSNEMKKLSDQLATSKARQEEIEREKKQALDDLEQKERELTQQIQDLRRELDEKNDELERLRRDSQRQSASSNEVQQRLNRALSDLQEQNSANEQLSNTLAQRESELAQAQHERDSFQQQAQQLQSERDAALSQLESLKQASSSDSHTLQVKIHELERTLEQEREGRQSEREAARDKLEKAKQEAQRLHDAEVERIQEEHDEELRNLREQMREEHSREMAKMKEDVSQNASEEMDTRLGLVRAKVEELGRRESRLLSEVDTLRAQVTDAKYTADEEYQKRRELENALREAAEMFKQELYAKNEQLRQLQREVKHLRDWYMKGLEVVANDVHSLRVHNNITTKAAAPFKDRDKSVSQYQQRDNSATRHK